MIRSLFSRRWVFATLLVIVAAGVMFRLGLWQLDRLEARKLFNARVLGQQAASEMMLDLRTLDQDLYEFEYRKVRVRGTFLPEEEFLLRNQAWEGQSGYLLFTPLLIEGGDRAVIVQRGWIAAEKAGPSERAEFIKNGPVELSGILRRAETDFNVRLNPDPTLMPSESRLDIWNHLDLERIADQMDTPILNMYVQILPTSDELSFPLPFNLQLDLTEGSHLGYAGQWFLFAMILLVGYPVYVNKSNNSPEIQ